MLLSAFARFSRTSPSRLAFDKARTAGHVETIDGLAHGPCDTYRRAILEAVSPEWLRPLFTSIFRPLQRGQALEAMACWEGSSFVALAGTGSCSATPIHCASCLPKVHRHGSVTYAHQLLGAALIHPDVREVLPLRPEPSVKHDGADKHAGERHAATRVVAKLRQDHPHLTCIVTEDRLRSNAPHIEPLHADDLHDILGVKEGNQAFLFPPGQAAEHTGRVTDDARHDRAAGLMHRVRWVKDVPLHEANAAVRVHVIESWESGDDQGQHCSWVTDWRVSKRNVFRLMRGGRARWKMAHATFKTLNNQGDHFEHHDGHGTQHLSGVFALLLMVAFWVDQTPQLCGALLQAVGSQLGRKRLRWERMRALCDDDALEARRQRLEAVLYGVKKPKPSVASDSSSRASDALCDRRP